MLILHPFADKEPWLGLQEGPLPLDLVPASLGMWFFLRSAAPGRKRSWWQGGPRHGSCSLGMELKQLSGFLTVSLQRNSSLPDENNVARLQEELKALKVRESEAVASARELKSQLQELSDTWQVRTGGEGAPSRICLEQLVGLTSGLVSRTPSILSSRPIFPAVAVGRSPRGSWSWANCRTSS